jgi:ATP-dependent RNA circularization protein (DNA/RNA ligase family)
VCNFFVFDVQNKAAKEYLDIDERNNGRMEIVT